MLESKSCLLPGGKGPVDNVTARTDLRSLLLDNPKPLPLGGPTPNNIFGSGLADARTSASATVPIFSGPATLSVGGNTPTGVSFTAAQLGFAGPVACPMASLSWTGGCGTGPASTMNCPFGTTNVSVMASNALSGSDTLAYSPAANIQIVVVNFSLGVAPGSATVAAGTPAPYTVTATAQGGTFPGAITLACSNLPTATTCSFNPLTIIPGAASAQSTLTITTTARAFAPSAQWQPTIRMLWPASYTDSTRSIPLMSLVLAMSMVSILGLWGKRPAPGGFRRRFVALGALSLALAFLTFQAGCGGGAITQPPPATGTPAGTYSINVSATSGTLVQSGTASLTVQ